MLFVFLACTGSQPEPVPPTPPEVAQPTGVTRTYEWTVAPGGWDLWLNAEQVVGRATGYAINGEFWGPTLVADLGDTVRLTLDNQTTEAIGITPAGLRYDLDNDGLTRLAEPGGSVTYTWEAMVAPGVYLYRSRILDTKLRERQAMAGILGLVVVRGREWQAEEDMHFVNALMVRTYPPFTEVDNSIPGPARHGGFDTNCEQCVDTGIVIPGDKHASHNQALVLQEVRLNPAGENARNPWVTDTLEVPRVAWNREQDVRIHGVAYGTDEASLHLEGLPWEDPSSDRTITTVRLGPGETTWITLPAGQPLGPHRIENFATHDYGLMSGWIDVGLE